MRAVVVAIGLWGVAVPGLAQGPQPTEPVAEVEPASRVWSEVTLFERETGSGASVSAVASTSLLVAAEIRVTPHLEIAARWPVVVHVSTRRGHGGEDDSDGRMGNPFVGGRYLREADWGDLRIGGGVALPVATSGLVLGHDNFRLASATRGLVDGWLYVDDAMGFVGMGSVEHAEGWLAGAEMAVALIVPIEDDGRLAQVRGQWRLWGGGAWPIGRAGVYLNVVHEPEETQVSIEPFVEATVGPVIGMVRFVLNVDEPFGLSFVDDFGTWGLVFGAGGRW